MPSIPSIPSSRLQAQIVSSIQSQLVSGQDLVLGRSLKENSPWPVQPLQASASSKFVSRCLAAWHVLSMEWVRAEHQMGFAIFGKHFQWSCKTIKTWTSWHVACNHDQCSSYCCLFTSKLICIGDVPPGIAGKASGKSARYCLSTSPP